MSSFRRGDVVSLSRAQATLVTVLSTPAGPDEPYSVSLPVNGAPRAFTVLGQPGETLTALAARLEAALLDEQTVYSVAVGADPTTILVVGKLGLAFDASSSANVSTALTQSSVLAVEGHSGRPLGPIRVLAPTNTLERLREFWTIDRDRNVLFKNQLQGRELDTSNVFDFDASQVLTVLHREGF